MHIQLFHRSVALPQLITLPSFKTRPFNSNCLAREASYRRSLEMAATNPLTVRPSQAPSTEKRDALIRIEKQYQTRWKDAKIFEINAPTANEIPYGSKTMEDIRKLHPKFFGTMAYPYLNGTMHAGHSFTASKIEFAIGFARMQGKRALFPLGFHCTGMPIKACADKLAVEIRLFGANFERFDDEEWVDDGHTKSTDIPALKQETREDVTKFVSKKSKATGKTVKLKFQFQIMQALGIPKEDIHRFADAAHWLQYFPPVCIRDLENFGARIDWRRQFVTTDANPYYDSFIRWQMNRLRQLNKILYGSRYTVYSPKDGQPCMDHDRTEGEGIIPQEYTAVKLEVKELSSLAAEIFRGKVPSHSRIFFVGATLRPETVYGQTCCFVGPSIEYGLYRVSDNEYYIVTDRAAWNMAFQGTFFTNDNLPRQKGDLYPILKILGSQFVGTLVNAPLSFHTSGVRVLPMNSILATKGTGVVMSVPSDSPDDYVTLRDLSQKAKYYGIKREWAELEIRPIIDTPTYGGCTAETLVNEMRIASPKDTTRLAEAKALAYKEGHYKGRMLVGEFRGELVSSAKEKIRSVLFGNGEAFPYAEPDGKVISRSGDECVVAYLGQWFLNYGSDDARWQEEVIKFVSGDLNTFSLDTKNQLIATIQWLNRWACARSYGLGSKLPWDSNFVVESLTDSTIYQAYYTIAHLLHADRFGKEVGAANVRPEQMIDEVWDCVFAQRPIDEGLIESSRIAEATLQLMRREFEYWYPLDMGVTGKDLVPNHVTFFLYTHVALFPPQYWPKSVRSNGHLLLNGAKMSKSTGNFLTLKDAVEKYGADATRVALADAGDAVEDANFEETVANSTILRLYNLKQWCEEMMSTRVLRSGAEKTLWDTLFDNEMDKLVRDAQLHYEGTNYKIALRTALYDFVAARDFYREAVIAAGIGMHIDLVQRYIELQALVVAPIIPHWADYIWSEVLKKTELWPSVPKPSTSLTAALSYIRTTLSNINSTNAGLQKRKDKGRSTSFSLKEPKCLTLFVAARYPLWQEKATKIVQDAWNSGARQFDEKQLNMKIVEVGEQKKVRPFVQSMRTRLLAGEDVESVAERKLAFQEWEILLEIVPVVRKLTGFDDMRVIRVDDPKLEDVTQISRFLKAAVPGQPSFSIENLKV